MAILIIFFNFNKINPVNLTLSFLLVSRVIRVISLVYLNKWFFYVFILFYIGGIIIMFTYIISLLNTEKFVLIDFTRAKLLLLALGIFIVIDLSRIGNNRRFLTNLYKSFELISPLFLASVLLVALIVVIKICNIWEGSLKSKINE